ncbi:dTDP-4-amino-4,6-dideoxy-D-galactose acyltransferase [Pseudoalteromonas tunicata]|uniref:dTDP-4-amino-4,6-dideoxy-D-galactose acyltransferase n=1 Tax=Pseudoalteromonas tunicata TaxID=314281 RepID=UPI00273F2665|nr:dTDP-4-amino-4,6-dideoxy-D-galactose acyltransferase [Pseudoalteromonas tunicata]MDP5211683.1 dTDP-4-amino-4,6-dideoxy-D-galactose acyltransferase [Pseudoalteromonas tunicata]
MGSKAKLRHLEWDSNFFGQSIANLEINNEINHELDLNGYSLIQCKVPCDNYVQINNLQECGFSLSEGEIDFSLTVLSYDIDISLASVDDSSQILEICDDAFVFSRFRAPWFSEEQANVFYQTWAKKAITGEHDDCCLILKENNIIKGFITLKCLPFGEARIGLILVSNKYQRQGVSQKLLSMANQYCINKNISKLFVATQISNKAAINTYIKHGFQVNTLSYWFYKKNDSI